MKSLLFQHMVSIIRCYVPPKPQQCVGVPTAKTVYKVWTSALQTDEEQQQQR